MFISIPKEFFVPVIFGEGFTLNEENNNLELDLSMNRESTGKKNNNTNLEGNKEQAEISKSAKEKQDIVNVEVNMDENKCKDKANVEEIIDNNKNKNETKIYVSSEEIDQFEKICGDEGKIFEEIDCEFIENININLKGCNKNCD